MLWIEHNDNSDKDIPLYPVLERMSFLFADTFRKGYMRGEETKREPEYHYIGEKREKTDHYRSIGGRVLVRFIKLLDVVLVSAPFITAWLMIVLALIIRSDGGTAFYRQKRLTKYGRVFDVLKFRSMRMDAEKDGVARLSTGEKDPRITKAGHFIRACRMNELPQLINILKGDMSIVGPRPERPEIAEQYKQELPEFDLRLQCRCGLTGYAQVYS